MRRASAIIEPDGQLGDGIVEHIGRVGDANVAGLGGDRVDRVVADAKIGDDLQLRKLVHERWPDPAARDAADLVPDGGQERVLVRHLVQPVDRIAGREGVLTGREERVRLKNVDRHGDVPVLPIGLKCGNKACRPGARADDDVFVRQRGRQSAVTLPCAAQIAG